MGRVVQVEAAGHLDLLEVLGLLERQELGEYLEALDLLEVVDPVEPQELVVALEQLVEVEQLDQVEVAAQLVVVEAADRPELQEPDILGPVVRLDPAEVPGPREVAEAQEPQEELERWVPQDRADLAVQVELQVLWEALERQVRLVQQDKMELPEIERLFILETVPITQDCLRLQTVMDLKMSGLCMCVLTLGLCLSVSEVLEV